jgi:hypothetical protein
MRRSESVVVGSAIENFAAHRSMRDLMRFGRGGRFSLSAGLALLLFSTASLGQASSYLTGAAAITPSDAWAVGNRNTVSSHGVILAEPLAEHWDGTKWSVIPTADPGGGCNTLASVAAVTSNDVWAVGDVYYEISSCGNGRNFPTFIEHWDGVAWSIVPSPSPIHKRLTGVAAISSNDVWAVGYSEPSINVTYTLTEHWDGSMWKVVPSPSVQSQQTYFNAVTAVATDDVWAVGSYLKSPANVAAPFAEHWDGTTWKIVPVPDPGSGYSFLFGTSSSGAHEIWTTGYIDLAYRWDGANWNPSPVPKTGGNLGGVFALPNGQAWAVGYQTSNCCVSFTLTELWDGKAWTAIPSPNPSSTTNGLGAISGTGPTDLWAVGQYGGNNGADNATLIEHWDGTAWTVVPSP